MHQTLSKKEEMTNSDRQVLAGKMLKTGQKLLVQLLKAYWIQGPVSTDNYRRSFLVLIPVGIT